MEDMSRLGGRLQELCLCLEWPRRHGTERGGMANIHCSQSVACGLAWLMCLGVRSTDWEQLGAGSWGRRGRGTGCLGALLG